jgi:outer membrane protein, heavy metal efflux system
MSPRSGEEQPVKRSVILLFVAMLVGDFGRAQLFAQTSSPEIPGARRVSLQDALRRVQDVSLDLRLARGDVATAEALRTSAGIFPNPGISAVHEQLGGDGGVYSETVIALAQVLELGGQRGLRRAEAERMVEAAAAQLDAERQRMAFEVHRAYVRAAQAEADLAAQAQTVEEFRRVEGAGRARFVEGDISRFDSRRLQFERARYETLVAQAQLRLADAGRELALLTEAADAAASLVALPAETLDQLAGPSLEATLAQALASATERAEVRAAEAEVEAARAGVSLQLRERIPDLTLSGGYKHQTDGRQGAVFGLALPLPLWNRNGGELAVARSELEAAQFRRDLVRLRVENEIRRAFDTYRSHRDRMALLAEQLLPESAGLLETARVAYDEGEMSLLELLDAADIYRSSRETLHQLLADALISKYDLERAMGRLLEPTATGARASSREENR